MNGKTKSILLQVAFKEAVTSVNTQGLYANGEVKQRTLDFYKMLIDMHDELNIDAEDGRAKGGTGGGARRAPAKPTPDEVTTFIDNDGELWEDYRAAKAAGVVKQGHPDFKAVNLRDNRNQRLSVWMYSSEGNPNTEAAPLVTAADGVSPL